MTIYDDDQTIADAADKLGMQVDRYQRMEIDALLVPEKLFSRQPDRRKIKAALAAGENVPGVTVGEWEFRLRKLKGEANGAT